MKKFIFIASAIATLFASCSKETSFDNNTTGKVKIKFDHIAHGKKFVLDTELYTNNSGETYTVSMLKYYISNIKLTKINGEVYEVPQKDSYFLIDESKTESLQPIISVPEGEYRSLQFNLGIDSATNVQPLEGRLGVLDIANNDMYWSWNSGYIFFKLEGSSTAATSQDKKFRYHIGLYGGMNSPTVNNNKIIKLDLTNAGTAKVQQNLSADIHLITDIGQVFNGSTKISIASNSTVMTTGPHQAIANNYAGMFTHDHTHNYQKLGE